MSANKTEIFQDSSSSGEFKQCSNGHYYQGATCPYCKGNNGTSGPTVGDNLTGNATIPQDSGNVNVTVPHEGGNPQSNQKSHNCTEFGPDTEPAVNGTYYPHGSATPRFSRKLVGWLVTYSNDPLGVDYKLFEGRNIIGRDIDCNISVNDGRVSAKHAVLLYRAGKYSITDTQSSHGTFVNDEDIELESRYINDGDVIRVGNTIFKFRSSL